MKFELVIEDISPEMKEAIDDGNFNRVVAILMQEAYEQGNDVEMINRLLYDNDNVEPKDKEVFVQYAQEAVLIMQTYKEYVSTGKTIFDEEEADKMLEDFFVPENWN